MKPIIKWAGGKAQLLSKILPLIPDDIGTYYEPFFGGGAVFFALEPERAVINDFNPQLTNLYERTRDNLDKLKDDMLKLSKQHNEDNYYLVRKQFNECLINNELSVQSAAMLVYLNKAGFNGLYRLNSKGLYNVPSAKRKKVNLFDEENINSVSELLKKADILTGDFERACQDAKEGDFIFFDSPYYNTFDTYQAGGFSEDDHRRLAWLFRDLTDKGVKCMLTNSNEDFIKELYKDYNIEVIDVKRMINSDATKRSGQEIIVTNY